MALRTEKQFRTFLRECALEAQGDGFEVDQIAYDLADSLRHNFDVAQYINKHHPFIKTKQQQIEFIADYLVL